MSLDMGFTATFDNLYLVIIIHIQKSNLDFRGCFSYATIGCLFLFCKKFNTAALNSFALPFAILALMPTYAMQALIGHLDSTILVDDLTYEHRIVLYIGILLLSYVL